MEAETAAAFFALDFWGVRVCFERSDVAHRFHQGLFSSAASFSRGRHFADILPLTALCIVGNVVCQNYVIFVLCNVRDPIVELAVALVTNVFF